MELALQRSSGKRLERQQGALGTSGRPFSHGRTALQPLFPLLGQHEARLGRPCRGRRAGGNRIGTPVGRALGGASA